MAEFLKVTGLDEALATLRQLKQPQLDRASQKVISAAARSLVAPIRHEAPVLSGALARSVSARRGKKTNFPSAIVGPRSPHRHLVIQGTKPHAINHPGTRPNPFVDRGIAGQDDRIEQFVLRQLVKELHL
jgi:HK97 gp10 family phage protein